MGTIFRIVFNLNSNSIQDSTRGEKNYCYNGTAAY